MKNKIYLLNGNKVWLDPDTAPAEAIPLTKPKKAQAEQPAEKAQPAPANKAKKATANKARKAGSNK